MPGRPTRCATRTSTTPILTDTIVDIWTMSRRSYGSPRVHAELKLGQDVRCSRKRVERLMRQAGDRRHPPAPPRRLHPAGPRCRTVRRPGPAGLRSHRAGPLVGDGRDRAPDRERQGLPGRGPRRLLPPRRGLVDRRSHAIRARGRRPPDGHLAPSSTRWADHRPFGSRIDLHVMGLRSTPPRERACSAPWDRWVTASITPWPRASSARSSSSCSTSITGRAASNSPRPSSSGSRPGTTRGRRHSYCHMLSPVDYEAAHAA